MGFPKPKVEEWVRRELKTQGFELTSKSVEENGYTYDTYKNGYKRFRLDYFPQQNANANDIGTCRLTCTNVVQFHRIIDFTSVGTGSFEPMDLESLQTVIRSCL